MKDLRPPDPVYLAETRTLMAQLRTGLAIAGAGALVSQLLLTKWSDPVVTVLSMLFVVIGYVTSWSALYRHAVLRRRERAAGRELSQPSWVYVPMTLALQALLLVVLVLYLLRR